MHYFRNYKYLLFPLLLSLYGSFHRYFQHILNNLQLIT
nr:MAG TPA: hypothetical protein [Caudoviricetes sp.]